MADFASEYGIRLRDEQGPFVYENGTLRRVPDRLPWAEFRDLLTGLLQTDSRLWRHFTRDDTEVDDGL